MNEKGSSREPLPGLAVYNPGLLKKENLIAQFVARRSLLDHLVEALRSNNGTNGNKHQLIVGPRGSGKTMLLRRISYAIEDDAELSSRWVPLVFPEEQYNISRLSDLWVNCLSALSEMLDRRERKDEAESIDQQIERLPAGKEKSRAQAALDLLIGWAKREDRRLVLLFDNANLIFDRLEKEHWAIREILSDNCLLFIGATGAPLESVYDHHAAFCNFFKVHEMRGLDDRETREVILNLAQLRRTPHVAELLDRDPGRVRSLNLLAGGNLRTIVVLYQVLAQGNDDNIGTDLEQLLDQYTPLYKHRFESLSTQSQQVVDALALNWDPVTAADLAEKLRLETNAVSAVLNRLVKDGVVERASSPPGEKMFFQIAERFFNIWYLMRASRRVRRKLIWLVEFLKTFYGAAGLYSHARHIIQEPPPSGRDQSQRSEAAIRKAIELAPNEANVWNGLGGVLGDHLRRYEEAEAAYRKAIELNPNQSSLWGNFGLLLQNYLKRYEEAEAAYRKSIEYNPNQSWSWIHLANLLANHLKRYEEAEVAIRKAIELDPSEARQWMSIGNLLGDHLKKREEAEAAYSKAEAAYREAIELDPREALNWVLLGQLLSGYLKRYEEAEAAFHKAIELDPDGSWPWNELGQFLANYLKRYEEAEAAYRKAIELNPNALGPWRGLGALFHYRMKERLDEAEAAYRKFIELYPNHAETWHDLGKLLGYFLNRPDEAEEAFRKAVELDEGNVEYLKSLAWQRYQLAQDLDEAELHLRRAVELEPDNIDFTRTLSSILIKRGRWDEAIVLARRFISNGDSEFHEQNWPDIIIFFRDAVTSGHVEDAIGLLDEMGYGERWRPLREALRAIAEDDSSYLLRIAPEVRQPAEEIVTMLLPEGVKLGNRPKKTRAKRSRRKKSLS